MKPPQPIPTTWQTARCTLRPATEEDYQVIHQLYNHPHHMQWIQDGKVLWTLPEVKGKWERLNGRLRDGIGLLVIEGMETGEILGECGLLFLDRSPGYIELGIMIAEPFQGKGFAEEVCRSLIDHWRKYHPDLPLRAVARIENLPSQQLLRKLGFREAGIERFGTRWEHKVYLLR